MRAGGAAPCTPARDASLDAHSTPAKFITFEGGEAAGKTTQLKRLLQTLSDRGIEAIATREPGGASGAETLRELLLHGRQDWSPLAETMLHFAARAEHVARTIRPALAAGRWVLSDRFTDSTRAYQGYGQGASLEHIDALQKLIGLAPDLTLVLTISPAIAAERMRRRGTQDRYERLGPAFFAKVDEGFRQIAAADPARCVVIVADGPEAEVAAAIREAVRTRLGMSSL